jgi:hypothetical protein
MGFWRKCRISFRWFRRGIWLLTLLLIGAFLWFNRVGLPDFLKTRLVDALRKQGVELAFSRMRLSLVRGIVADNVRAGESGNNKGASFTARFVQLDLDFGALRHRRLELDGLVLRDGVFTLPLSATNSFVLTNLQAQLRFGAGDIWSLDQLRADFDGARISINGEIVHAREALAWKIFSSGGGDRGMVIASLKDFSDVLPRIHFQGEPQLRLNISGDGRNLHSIKIQLDAGADAVRTPWFAANKVQAGVTLTAPADAPTDDRMAPGFWKNLQPFRLAWSAQLHELRSEKLDANNVACSGVWAAPSLTVSNLSARLGGGNLHARASLDVPSRRLEFKVGSKFDPHAIGKFLGESTRTQLAQISWTQLPSLQVEGALRLPAQTNGIAVDWHYDIEPSVQLRGELAFTNATVRGMALDHIRTHFRFSDLCWAVPDLTIKQGRTQLSLGGEVSEVSENFRFALSGQVDAESARAFLSASNATALYSNISMPEPLTLALVADGNLRSLESLSVTGRVAVTNFAVRGQQVDSVAGAFSYTNLNAIFFAPDLFRAGGAQRMTADTIRLDLKTETIWFDNGWSTAEPLVVARAVGPKTGKIMEQFQFLGLPLVHVTGSAPLRNVNTASDAENADLTFEVVRGTPFRWLNLQSTNLTGTIRWHQQMLIVTNLQGALYGGSGRGYCNLDFAPPNYAFDCNFMVTLTNVNLHLLAMDVASPTNRLEGQLSGQAVVSYANSVDWRSWQGIGDVRLRDGLLWDVPIFAFMSPVLNAVSPGLGNSRATEATAKFIITNGVISTDSLLIRAQTMRLQYAGTVDLEKNVNARVTAQLLRNVPVLGPVVSTALWPLSKIFECRVTGQLDKPVVAPVYIPGFIPKLLSVPLHPIRSLGDMFTSPPTNSPSTNSPAAAK